MYSILNVPRSASQPEIKKAYKKLAVKWHPDKNKDPEAGDNFIKINEAYETLGDSEKRAQYDNFGTTSGQAQQQHAQRRDFFGGGFDGFNFHFGGRQTASSVQKYRITLGTYENHILPESDRKPYLIYAYTDFCFQCMQMEAMWERIVADLQEVGLGMGTVHAQLDPGLARKLKISTVPSILAVVSGRITWYDEGAVSVQKLRDFVRSVFPSDLITPITYKESAEKFLSGWRDNHVRVLFFATRERPTQRFLAAAFAHRYRVKAGYMNMQLRETEALRLRYRVPHGKESLLMFNEEAKDPVAYVTMYKLSRNALDELIDANQFLMLPRLSSQGMFNQLCPHDSTATNKRLCVILLTKTTLDHDVYRASFRQFAGRHTNENNRVTYMYIYEEPQKRFVDAITRGKGITNESGNALKVAILWRLDRRRVQYDWLPDGWAGHGQADNGQRLVKKLDLMLRSRNYLPHTTELPNELTDEHVRPLLSRILLRLSDWRTAIWDKITSVEVTTLFTFATTIAFVLLVGYISATATNSEEGKRKSVPNGAPQQQTNQSSTVYLHPFCRDSFERLVLKTEQGVRTILLLVNGSNKEVLLQHFARIVHRHSNNDSYIFAFLDVEHHLGWFRDVLRETASFPQNLDKINAQNCAGTVLAINGPRRYYTVYYPRRWRHQHGKRSIMTQMLGFADTDSSDDTDAFDDCCVQPDLVLRNFDAWMDRLYEGSLKRYRVEKWPVPTS